MKSKAQNPEKGCCHDRKREDLLQVRVQDCRRLQEERLRLLSRQLLLLALDEALITAAA